MRYVNRATLNLIKEFEGCSLDAYRDPVGIWTIGYGTTAAAGVGIEPRSGMSITAGEAESYLMAGLEKFAAQIEPMFKKHPTENEFGAMLSLAYNIGPGAFSRSTALKRHNAGDRKGAADAILMWNKAGGKKLAGLVRRREAERVLYLAPVAADEAPAPIVDRSTPAKSTTMQASAAQVVAGVGAAGTAIGALDGEAQKLVLAFAGIVVLGALWVMRERLRKWADGDR